MPGRIEVPRSISEAPIDRLVTSVKIDSILRAIPGARAPTFGTEGVSTTRTPSEYLLGDRSDAEDNTTVEIVMRALVGTTVFDHLDKQARASASVELDWRSFGPIIHRFGANDYWAIAAKVTASNPAKGLSELTPKAATSSPLVTKPSYKIGDEEGTPKLRPGGVLEVVDNSKTKEDIQPFTVKATFTKRDHNPEFLVLQEVLYDDDGANPKLYVAGQDAAVGFWPNDGNETVASVTIQGQGAGRVVYRDQSVKWTAKGTVDSFEPSFAEDSSLYTLRVILSEAMPKATIIHSAEVFLAADDYE